MKHGEAQKHDLTLHFAERPHSERVAEDVVADFYPPFVFLLLPLCHLLRYRRLAELARCGECAACLPAAAAAACGAHTEGRGTALLRKDRSHRRLCPVNRALPGLM